MPSKYNFITVEGNIGAGKTTLAKMLADEMSNNLILERFDDNPFLPLFYSDQERYAFPLEMFFMAERYQQLQNVLQGNLFDEPTISDYLFAKSMLFAQTNLNEVEMTLYLRVFRIIYEQLPKPAIILYLHKPVEDLLESISKRGRPYEKNIKKTYLKKIEKAYFQYFRLIKNEQRILIIDCKNIDFVKREIDYLRIKNLLRENWDVGMQYL